MVNLTMVSLLLARGIYTDVRWGKIENQLIILGSILGIGLAYTEGGGVQVWNGVKMAGFMLVVLFLLFVIKGLGAGDIKLLGMLAVYMPDRIVRVTALAFLVAAGYALLRMVVRCIRKQQWYTPKETLHFSIPIAVSIGVVQGINWLQ